MQLKHFTLCAVSLAATAGTAEAGSLVQIDSLKQLPLDVQAQLRAIKDPIADRDERFNASCVVTDGTPQRRFLLGAVAEDLVVVAIEIGGFVHHSVTIEWRRRNGQWLRFDRKDAVQFPKTLQELLQTGSRTALAALA